MSDMKYIGKSSSGTHLVELTEQDNERLMALFDPDIREQWFYGPSVDIELPEVLELLPLVHEVRAFVDAAHKKLKEE